MTVHIILFLVGLVLLYYGAKYLISGGKLVAGNLGIPTIIIGITVIAFGTSLPELIVSILANRRGEEGIVLGNIIGSNIANIGLVLGLAALISPIFFDYARSKVDLIFLLVVTVIFSALLLTGHLVLYHGVFFLLLLTGYCFYLYRTGREDLAVEVEPFSMKMIFFLAFGIGGLWLGSHLFVSSAVAIAEILGVPKIALGMTLVALGTSVPELATSIVAASHGESEIAVGNVIGSNLFNILAVMGTTLLIRDITFDFSQILVNTVLMLAFTAAILMLLRFRNRISRAFGAVFVAGYLYSCYVMFV